MREVVRSALVPYTPAQMFALVEDVERYPEFLPWVTGASVARHIDTELLGTLEMERAGMRERFTTRNTLEPPARIGLSLVEGPFRTLDGEWTFTPIESAGQTRGTRIALEIRFEFRNPLMSLLMSRTFESSFASLIDAFTRRAKSIYGTHGTA